MQADTASQTASRSDLLCEQDPAPVELFNVKGSGPFVLTCEHAGRAVPQKLGTMGLSERHFDRHIAWDIGAAGLARRMAELLDAPLVLQQYSRLVIDCNRPLTVNDSIPEVSDGTEIPANLGLKKPDRESRCESIHKPYHDRISAILDARAAAKKSTAIIAIHSFTPCLEAKPAPRPWDVGLLYNHHERLSHQVATVLADEASYLNAAFNEPYCINDQEDYTIPVHGEQRGIPNMLFEVRNDHIAEEAGQHDWANLLNRVLSHVASRM